MSEYASGYELIESQIRPRSGRQKVLSAHGYAATIASIGATLRTLTFEGRDLVLPFNADEVRPAYRGATLAPWPNRIVDGRYVFGGREHQLPLNEVARAHALHGLLAWSEFNTEAMGESYVLLSAIIEPQAGYPYRVGVNVEYLIDEDGLHQTVTAHNLGEDVAPWGTGPHPYLVAEPGGRVDDWWLTLPASSILTVTPERLIPEVINHVREHPEWDFRSRRQIGEVFIDHAFTNLHNINGYSEVRLESESGSGVKMVWDQRCPWVQVHTADESNRTGLAIEPMTCPPNAFNSHADLIFLGAGRKHAASWRIASLG